MKAILFVVTVANYTHCKWDKNRCSIIWYTV